MTHNYTLPRPLETYYDPAAEEEIALIQEHVRVIRNVKAEYPHIDWSKVTVYTVFK